MPAPKLEYRILLSSPVDLSDERQSATEIIEDLSASLSETYPIVLRLVSWEHAMAEARSGAASKAGDSWDVYLGIAHTKFGGLTAGFANGTEEEFNRAYRLWSEGQGKRALMLYFKKAAVDLEDVDLDQFTKLKAFKSQVSATEGLAKEFTTIEMFKDLLRAHLTSVIIHLYNQQRAEFEGQSPDGTSVPSIFSPATVEEEYLLGILNQAESTMAGVDKLKSAIDAITNAMHDAQSKIESHEQAMQESGLNQDLAGMRKSVTALAKVMTTLTKSLTDRRREYAVTATAYFDSLSTTISLMKASLGGEMDVTSLRTKLADLTTVAESFSKVRHDTVRVIDKAPNLAPGVNLARIQLKREFKAVGEEVESSLALMKNLLDIAQS